MYLNPTKDYKTAEEVKDAFAKGKDFVIDSPGPVGGMKCSVIHFLKGEIVRLRYDDLKCVVDVEMTMDGIVDI